MSNLKGSIWFTRGWTLQELLAPSEVIFCDKEWQTIGILRHDPVLQEAVSDATRIEKEFLVDDYVKSKLTKRVPMAKKLSWASHRQTRRPEDMAYCLLGLLDVNMPLLYGEGAVKAFLRLQHVFIGQSDDESIFAWTRDADSKARFGILADDISYFREAGGIEQIHLYDKAYINRSPYTITNKGLRFESVAVRVQELQPTVKDDARIFPRGSSPSSSRHGTSEPIRHLWLIALNCRIRTLDGSDSGSAESAKSDAGVEVKNIGHRCAIALHESMGGIADRTMVNTMCPEVKSLRRSSTVSEENKFLIKLDNRI